MKNRILCVFGLDFEGGFDEASGDEVGGDGKELPVDVDAAGAADFPGYGAEVLFGMGCQHVVEGFAVALHFLVGGGSGGEVGDAGEGGGVR